jgi:hypothetical protein
MPNFCLDGLEKIKASRYFMVNDSLWEKFGVHENFLCVDFLGKGSGFIIRSDFR